MSENDIEASDNKEYSFRRHKSYSIEEIMAAGGPDAFAEKLGKSWQNVIAKLEKLPKDCFLMDEEFEEAMKTLNQSK